MTAATNNSHAQGVRSGTFARQADLPRVPLPDLADTCRRFLEWCRPLLTADQFEETARALSDFVRPNGPGEALHHDLLHYKDQPGVASWLDDFWDQRYLGRRTPVAINANFFFLFPDSGETQIARAVHLIAGALHCKHWLDTETLPVTMARGAPMCMEGSKALFATTRIPAYGRDDVRMPYSPAEPGPSRARHILVCHKGHLFRADVIGSEGFAHSEEELAAALADIRAASPTTADTASSIGHLTTMAREAWVDHRKALLADPGNAALIEQIETALFIVALEDDAPETDLTACDQLLHGNSANRYFDKGVTLIVFANGRAGINIEHCRLDGTVVLEFVDFLLGTDTASHLAAVKARPQGGIANRELLFNLSRAQQDAVRKAAADFATFARATATTTFRFDDFGTEHIKHLKVSPDAFFQLGMQVAHQRTKGMIGATYESIAVRQYYHGRVEAMRVITPEIVTFVERMQAHDASRAERRAAFQAAAEAHLARARQCQAGEAPEQHLWELLMIYGRRGAKLGIAADDAKAARSSKGAGGLFGLFQRAKGTANPTGAPDKQPFAFYESPGWIITRDDFLSTSSAPAENAVYFGFGSTSPQCIGVGYVLRKDAIHAYLSTPAAQIAERDAFAEHLRTALRELAALIT
jgi:carnitine O-acetyltransferase